ncbi:hypothetical protein GQ457_12G024560 [Hibiscus cannabinus]
MFSPQKYHFFNGNSLGFGQEKVHEDGHYGDPSGEEQEDPELEMAKHGEETLSYDESKEKINSNRNALPCRPCFQWEYLTRYGPP